MKPTIFTTLMLCCALSFGASVEVFQGNSTTRPGYKYNSQRDMVGLFISHRWYYLKTYAMPVNGRLTTMGLVYRSTGKLKIDLQLGYGYLDHEDGETGAGYLTGRNQFDLYAGALYQIDHLLLGLGLQHASNCKSICNRGIHGSNKGADHIAFRIGYRF